MRFASLAISLTPAASTGLPMYRNAQFRLGPLVRTAAHEGLHLARKPLRVSISKLLHSVRLACFLSESSMGSRATTPLILSGKFGESAGFKHSGDLFAAEPWSLGLHALLGSSTLAN